MNLNNNFMEYDMMNMSTVDHNNMVAFPSYCTVKRDEKFAVVAINEGSAQIVPLDDYEAKCTELQKLINRAENRDRKQLRETELHKISAATICQVRAIVMSENHGKTTYGIKVDQFSGFLDAPDQNGKQCVIFQNINGILVMHYGRESYKNNVTKKAIGKLM